MNSITRKIRPLLYIVTLIWGPQVLGVMESNLLLHSSVVQDEEGSAKVVFAFEKEVLPNDIDIRYVENYIQIQFSKTYTMEPSKFIDGVAPGLKKIFVMQATPKVIVARLILDQPAEQLKDKLLLNILGKTIEAVLPFKAPSAIGSVKSDLALPISEAAVSPYSFGSKTDFPMNKITTISIFLLVLVSGALGIAKLVGKKQFVFGQAQISKLSSFTIDSKKSLLLVDVKGEEILIGVTPESITMLKVVSTGPRRVETALPEVLNPGAKTGADDQAKLDSRSMQQFSQAAQPVETNSTFGDSDHSEKASVEALKVSLGSEVKKAGSFAELIKKSIKRPDHPSTEEPVRIEDTIQDVTDMIRNKLKTMQSFKKDVG